VGERRQRHRTAEPVAAGPAVEARERTPELVGGLRILRTIRGSRTVRPVRLPGRLVADEVHPPPDLSAALRAVTVGHQRDAVAVVAVERRRERVGVVAPEPPGREREREQLPVAGLTADRGDVVGGAEREVRLATEGAVRRQRDRLAVHALGVGPGFEPAADLQAGVGEFVGLTVPVPAEVRADELSEVVGEPGRGRLVGRLEEFGERPLRRPETLFLPLEHRPDDRASRCRGA